MASAAVNDGAKLSIGNVFSRGVSAVHSDPAVFFGIVFLFSTLPSVALGILQRNMMLALQGGASFAAAFSLIVGGVAGFALIMITQGALVRATLAASEGVRVGFGPCVATGIRYLLPLLVASILGWLAIMVGLLLIAVPGIILATMWAVVGPAMVAEDLGIVESFGRSRALTKGSRWRSLGFFVLLAIILTIVSGVAQLLGFALGQSATDPLNPPIGTIIFTAITGLITTTYLTAWIAALFIEVRSLHSGGEPDHLEEVFA
ncbi:hypothetical protein [Sphingomonas sp.]|uniref:hypothetical protein n=1 Tax=Sphingomonas sp. TaxID=28214 RepID=UPI0025FC1B28|nr:hypothetical protein [Sphingomonas sp.]